MPTSRILNAKGFVLFELLIAMTILAGSITILHTIFANLVAKQIKLQKIHADLIENANQAEIQIAQDRLQKVLQWPCYLASLRSLSAQWWSTHRWSYWTM